jgi:hypothetical protein
MDIKHPPKTLGNFSQYFWYVFVFVATLILKEGEGEDSHSQNGSLGVHRDSQTFREQLQGSKHLALGSSLYRWKVIEV